MPKRIIKKYLIKPGLTTSTFLIWFSCLRSITIFSANSIGEIFKNLHPIIAIFVDKSPNSSFGELSIEKSILSKVDNSTFCLEVIFSKIEYNFFLKSLDIAFKNCKDRKIFCEY